MSDAYYNIISAADPVELEQRVNNVIKAGFKPIGGPVVEKCRWYQATVYVPLEGGSQQS